VPDAQRAAARHEAWRRLTRAVVLAGLATGLAMLVAGPANRLQMYGDGSIFSYSIAVTDAFATHWRNVSGRIFVYLYAFVPSEAYVRATGNARGGVLVYGLLHYLAPLLSLGLTFAADRSRERVVFVVACLSTATVLPLVFGFPTEMWLAHAVFWPTLALVHAHRPGLLGWLTAYAGLQALCLTHEGGVVLAGSIVATLALRGLRDPAFLRGLALFGAAMAVWLGVKTALRPDAYISGVLGSAAFNFISPRNLVTATVVTILAALSAYAILVTVLRRFAGPRAPRLAAVAVAAGLAAWWFAVDTTLVTQERYYMRTALLYATPALGGLAALAMLWREGRLGSPFAFAGPPVGKAAACLPVRALGPALALLMLVQAVEAGKFIRAWHPYMAAVRGLAMGEAADPELGDAAFVSSKRIDAMTDRMSWHSTTPYLSALVAPGMAPRRLVVDPASGYFWLNCVTARRVEGSPRAVPLETRRLVRIHACRHRPGI
jgi:hypothetical protein